LQGVWRWRDLLILNRAVVPANASKDIRVSRRGLVRERESIPASALLDNWSEAPWTNGVQVDMMEDMEKLVVRTGNSLYEIIIIDGPSGEILVRGGQYFPELTPARLAGATLGGSFCKLRGIYAGFRMELYANGQRTVTTPVESVGVLASA
jgi:hypothetical protein